MSNNIFKYPIFIEGSTLTKIQMPTGAKILKVGLDPDRIPCIWALVDPLEETITLRTFEVVGKGWGFDASDKTYLETILDENHVWHIWEHLS